MKCPECDSTKTSKRGFKYTKKGKFQRYQCLKCGRTFSDSPNCFTQTDMIKKSTPRKKHPCPYCGCTRTNRVGFNVTKLKGQRRKMKCKKCARSFTVDPEWFNLIYLINEEY